MAKFFETYVFGQLNEDGNIVYFTPTHGGLVYKFVNSKGKTIKREIANPTEAQMNGAGWYRVVNVAEDGTDYINDNILYHYTGAVIEEPMPEDEPIPEDEPSADGE